MGKNITDRFLDSLMELSEQALSEKAVLQAKMSLIDYIACANIGEYLLHEENEAYVSNFQEETGISPVIGLGKKVTAVPAATLNGMNAHAAELDDGCRYGMFHPGAPIFSALLALAGSRKMDAKHFLKGVVTGYEAAIRLASAVQPGHKLRGYHASGTCGTIGAAIGLGAALDYSQEQMKTVLSAAATDSAGILQVMDDSSKLKPYNIGRAAAAAVNAACMGRTRLSGPEDILGGERGFLKVMAQDVQEEYLVKGLGDGYAMEAIYRKPYAACRHSHAAIEAALKLRESVLAEKMPVRRVEVSTYGLAVKGHNHIRISGPSSARMSIPYAVASALLYGEAGYQQFEGKYLSDQRLLELTEKVEVRESKELSALVPQKRAAVVRVETEKKVFECRVDFPKGEPENPITKEELEDKYRSLMQAAGREKGAAEKLLGDIWELETKVNDIWSEL